MKVPDILGKMKTRLKKGKIMKIKTSYKFSEMLNTPFKLLIHSAILNGGMFRKIQWGRTLFGINCRLP